MKLILLFFRGPFWVQFAVAAGLFWFGHFIQQDEAARQLARAALLEQAPPATISVADFHSDAPGRTPVELSVTAQIAQDYNTRLVRKTNFIKTGEDLFYVLVDPSPDADPNVALAGIVLDPDQLDAFIDWLLARSTGFGAAGPIATIDGLRESSSSASHARDAMKNQGMTISPNFFFIEPFIAGREASLTAIPEKAAQLSWPIYGFAAFMALMGVFKLRKSRAGVVRPPKPSPMPQSSDPARSFAGIADAYGLVQVKGIPSLAAAFPDAAPKSAKVPTSMGKKLVWFAGLALIAGAVTGQTWAYTAMPLLIFGLMFLGMRKGFRQVSEGLESVIANFTGEKANLPAATGMPVSAPVPAAPSTSAFAASPVKSKALDGGPIRAGFSWKDLMPKPKQKVAPGSDPFDRIARQRQQEQAAAQHR